MLFNSLIFLLFALLFFLFWPAFKKRLSARWIYLTVASFVFYGWWDWRFLFLILFSGLVDYVAGLAMIRYPERKKTFLISSLLTNLLSLSIFKYSFFFATIFDDLFLTIGLDLGLASNIPEFALILPVGISFYTFQSMSYTIDIYRGKLTPVRNIFHFFSYLSMFPQLVAGPIIRAKDLLHQLKKPLEPSYLQKWNAIKLMVFGLFQKVVIADNLAYMIDSAFQDKTTASGWTFWWAVVIAFAFQIYCDFSGYSLIARGLAKYMGFHFKMNFNHPYLSTGFREFWKRWHISLSNWFRDYVYIPLGGNQKGILLSIVFLWVSMLLSGLWHGANYTFIIWAGLHALYLTIERTTNWTSISRIGILRPLVSIAVFLQVCYAWVFFRADSFEQAVAVSKQLIPISTPDFAFIDLYFNSFSILLFAVIIEMVIALRKSNFSMYRKYLNLHLDFIVVCIALVCCIFLRGEGQQFIYFQF